MRASTLFAITLALLVGLGTAAVARMSGWLTRRSEPPPKKPEIQVLVTARNVFAGDVIEQTWVRVRPLKPEEAVQFEKTPESFLPAVTSAAVMRVARRNLEADQPLIREDLQPLAKPDSLPLRLMPNMRAVNLSLPKDRCAGGMILVGEWVDVHLTTTIEADDSKSAPAVTRTAPIANKVRVVAKRNILWNIYGALPDDKPVHFTLETNPYRAALIEFAKTKGLLALVPVSAAEQKALEAERSAVMAGNTADFQPVAVGEIESVEYRGEELRVQAITRGDLTVGSTDLVRIFGLTTPPPPLANSRIEQLVGIGLRGSVVFNADGEIVDDGLRSTRGAGARARAGAMAGFQFKMPDECPSCKRKKLQQQNQ
jgi:Flp pilus assembly protein CpaB